MSIALITGCSTGIGFAIAVAMARAGHGVVAAMRNPEAAPELLALAAEEGLPVSVVRLDVDSDESVRSAIAETLAKQGRIDVLVNNAGIGGQGPVEEADIGVFRRAMETNFFGVLRCRQAVLPGMRQQRSGHIVNISSIAGRIALAPQAPYAASKWALEGMSEVLAQEVRPFGIRVALIEPGFVATPMVNKAVRREWSSDYPQARRGLALFKAPYPNASFSSRRQDSRDRESSGPEAPSPRRPRCDRISQLALRRDRWTMDRMVGRGD